MRKGLLIYALTVMGMWLLTGCEQEPSEPLTYDLDQTGLLFQQDGSVTEVVVDAFEAEYYDVDELKSLIEDEVSEIDAITVSAVEKLNENQVRLQINYATGDAFSAYESEYIGILNYEDPVFYNGAIEGAGIEDTQDFVDTDGEAYDISKLKRKDSYQVAYSNQGGFIQVEGYIYCYSSNLTLVDNNSVQIPDGEDGFVIYRKN